MPGQRPPREEAYEPRRPMRDDDDYEPRRAPRDDQADEPRRGAHGGYGEEERKLDDGHSRYTDSKPAEDGRRRT